MLGDELRRHRMKPCTLIRRAEQDRDPAVLTYGEDDGRASGRAGRMLVDRDAPPDAGRPALVPTEGARAGIDRLPAPHMAPAVAKRCRITLLDRVAPAELKRIEPQFIRD